MHFSITFKVKESYGTWKNVIIHGSLNFSFCSIFKIDSHVSPIYLENATWILSLLIVEIHEQYLVQPSSFFIKT